MDGEDFPGEMESGRQERHEPGRGKETMKTEMMLNELQEEKIDTAIDEIRSRLENAHRMLPRLQAGLGDCLARAALGEDNHTQIARIRRRLADLEETIQEAPLVIKGLKRMKWRKADAHPQAA